jgi:hypothetical protein
VGSSDAHRMLLPCCRRDAPVSALDQPAAGRDDVPGSEEALPVRVAGLPLIDEAEGLRARVESGWRASVTWEPPSGFMTVRSSACGSRSPSIARCRPRPSASTSPSSATSSGPRIRIHCPPPTPDDARTLLAVRPFSESLPPRRIDADVRSYRVELRAKGADAATVAAAGDRARRVRPGDVRVLPRLRGWIRGRPRRGDAAIGATRVTRLRSHGRPDPRRRSRRQEGERFRRGTSRRTLCSSC